MKRDLLYLSWNGRVASFAVELVEQRKGKTDFVYIKI